MPRLLRIPAFSLFAGLLLMVLELIINFISLTTDSYFISDYYSVFNTFLAVVIFIGIGSRFLKDLSSREIFISATTLSVYYIVILLLQRYGLKAGIYSLVFDFLFLPTKLYSVLGNWLLEFFPKLGYWAYVPSILLPYMYLIFPQNKLNKQ